MNGQVASDQELTSQRVHAGKWHAVGFFFSFFFFFLGGGGGGEEFMILFHRV